MLSRRNWVVALVSLLLVASLAGCTSGIAVPDRAIAVDVNTALEAQNKVANLMTAGEVQWSEAEFSSLLSVLLDQNSGENNPVDAVLVWFEPGNKVIAQVALIDGVLPPTLGGDALNLSGVVSVEGGAVKLDLDGASAGGLGIDAAFLAPVNAQINQALAGLGLGVPVTVETDSGSVTVKLGM